MNWEQIWPAIPGLIALVATVTKIIADWRKGKAEAADLLVDSATEVVLLLRTELNETKAEVKDLKKAIVDLRARVARLCKQIKALGAVPVNGGPD